MQNQYPPFLEKSLFYIEKTQERLGWLVISVYRFPVIAGFGNFLEAVQRALVRHGLFSWYMWARDCIANQYLLVHLGRGQWLGHFEAECATIIPRLWQRYSDIPYMAADAITVNQQNKDDLEDWLARFLVAISAQQTAGPRIPLQWHQKNFGTAQIPINCKKIPSWRGDRTSATQNSQPHSWHR